MQSLRSLCVLCCAMLCSVSIGCGSSGSNAPSGTGPLGNPPPTPPDILSGTLLTVLGARDGTVYAVDVKESADGNSTEVVGVRANVSDLTTEEMGSVSLRFFRSAVVWDTSIIVLGAEADANQPKFYAIGGTRTAPVADLNAPIGILSNLATNGESLYVAQSYTKKIVSFAPDGSNREIDPGIGSAFMQRISAHADRVCATTDAAVFCSNAPGVPLDRGNAIIATPIVVEGDEVYQTWRERLVSVSSVAPALPFQLLASFEDRIKFEPGTVNRPFPCETTIVPSGDFLYVAGWQLGLLRVARAGGSVEALVTDHIVTSVAVDGSKVYYAVQDPGSPSTIHELDAT